MCDIEKNDISVIKAKDISPKDTIIITINDDLDPDDANNLYEMLYDKFSIYTNNIIAYFQNSVKSIDIIRSPREEKEE